MSFERKPLRFVIDRKCAKLVFIELEGHEPADFGLIVPGTRSEVCMSFVDQGWGSSFYAINSGVVIPVYDERANRGPCQSSGRVEAQQSYEGAWSVRAAFRDGLAIWKAARRAHIPIESCDAGEVKAALAMFTFVVMDERGIICRPASAPRKSRRREGTTP